MCECVSFEWLEKKRALDESNEIHSTTKMCILSLVACISTHFKCKMCSLRIFTGSRNTHDDYFDSKSRTANAMCIPNSQSHCFSDIIQLTIARHASHSIQQCTNTTSGKTHIYCERERERAKMKIIPSTFRCIHFHFQLHNAWSGDDSGVVVVVVVDEVTRLLFYSTFSFWFTLCLSFCHFHILVPHFSFSSSLIFFVYLLLVFLPFFYLCVRSSSRLFFSLFLFIFQTLCMHTSVHHILHCDSVISAFDAFCMQAVFFIRFLFKCRLHESKHLQRERVHCTHCRNFAFQMDGN